MKKMLLLSILGALMSVFPLTAQVAFENFEDGDNEYIFTRRTGIVSLAVGVPGSLFALPSRTPKAYIVASKMPSIVLEFDRGLWDLHKGWVVSYTGALEYVRNVTSLNEGVDLNAEQFKYEYHLKDADKKTIHEFDAYVGLGLHKSFSTKFEVYVKGGAVLRFLSQENDELLQDDDKKMIRFQGRVGGRYAFSKNLSVFAETGYMRDYARLGIAFQF